MNMKSGVQPTRRPLRWWLASAAAVPGLLVYSALARSHPHGARNTQGYPIDYENYISAAPEREARQASEREAQLDAALHGLEPHQAGLHLVRPVSDPRWDPKGDWTSASGGFLWRNTWVRYTDVIYQEILPVEFGPPVSSGSCALSLRRLFENGVGTPSYELDGTGAFLVKLAFDARHRGVLVERLKPLTIHADGKFVDWFGVHCPANAEPTEMRAVLVADDIAYVPFSVSALATNDVAPASVVVAKQLSQAEAADLVERLTRR